MFRVSILIGAAGVAMATAAALVAGGGAVPRLLSAPAPPVQATNHATMDHAAEPTAAKLVAAAASQVAIDNFTFVPATLTVAVRYESAMDQR
ncbi:MAG TPA: hypothetical protein VGU20_31745 [Stellaceae bacterium]|nr:hypothetical protein [Stellaceae bacterium]